MTRLRSIIFMLWLYGLIVFFGLFLWPIILISRRACMVMTRLWAKTVLKGLTFICGLKIEIRGLEHMPKTKSLIAAKHLSMLDTIVPLAILPDPCFVYKKSLSYLPFFGWYLVRGRMIAIKREEAAKALKQMLKDASERLKDPRQLIIFPEGTRAELGVEGVYKPGVAALYRELDCECALIATNSGQFWPAHGIERYAGTVVFEFLPPLPAGLKRGELMTQVKDRLETASNALISEFKDMARR